MNTPSPKSTRHHHDTRRHWSRVVAAGVSLALAATGMAAAPGAHAAPVTITGEQAHALVNNYIGSVDSGNTYPGAALPFGMVQLSPDTLNIPGGSNHFDDPGYIYNHNYLRGFSLAHMSGVGCAIAGFTPITPATSHPSSGDDTDYSKGGYARKFVKVGIAPDLKNDEEANPGYYRARVESGENNTINAELTATLRTGVQRYTYNTTGTTGSFVRINAGQSLSSDTSNTSGAISNSKVEIDAANRIVRTESTMKRFCNETNEFKVFTTTKFDTAFTSYGTWTGGTFTATSTSAASTQRTGASIEFPHNAAVTFQTGLSYVSADGADANLVDESPISDLSDNSSPLNFNGQKTAAQNLWKNQLGKVQVTQGDTNAPEAEREDQLATFYSALYRSQLAPNLGSDVDGKYRGWDGNVHSPESDMADYYQNFSLWDTYRTQQQWLYLIEPKKSADMAKSLVLQAEQSGWLPRWGYGPVETNIMTGDPGAPFLVSAWSQGLLTGEWANRAYAMLKKNATQIPPANVYANGRALNPFYLQNGYVPQDASGKTKPGDYDGDHGGSATLEYALADATISTMAAGLGHTADAADFALRGQNYRSLWDPATKTFRSRTATGEFSPIRPLGDDKTFHEGTSEQYTWLVQQDVAGLIGLLGGKSAAIERLDKFFAYEDIDLDANPGRVAANVGNNLAWWVPGTYDYYKTETYNPNNEPDLHAPYMYLWTGQPWKTTDVVREALTLFVNAPGGVTGNDDLGTMAAWQVMSSIGIYPIIPGKDVWGLTTPVFDKVVIDLDESVFGQDTLTIDATGASMTNRYAQSVTVGGTATNRAYLTGGDLTGAGVISYTLGTSPSATWATSDAAAPAPIAPVDSLPTRVMANVAGGQAIVAPGASVTTSVSLAVTGSGQVSGQLSVQSPVDISGVFTSGSAVSVSPQGGTIQQSLPVQFTAGSAVQPGTYELVLVLKTATGESTAPINVIVPEPSPLIGSFNNKAIGDRTGTFTARFNHTEPGGVSNEGFIRDTLAGAGMLPGKRYAHPSDASLSYVLHDAGVGSPATAYDNIVGGGSPTDLGTSFAGASKVAFIVTANNGNVETGTVTLHFTDSTTATHSVTATDWCAGSALPGNVRAGRTSERWAGSPQGLGCGLFATPVFDLGGKTLSSITWPNEPRFHVFAIAANISLSVTGSATIDGDAVYTPAGSVLTGTEPTFTPSSADVTVTRQWTRDGQPISGATGTEYTIQAADAGKSLRFAVTAYRPGAGSKTAVSEPAVVAAAPMTATKLPTIAGEAQVNKQLSVTPGTYSESGVAEEIQWLADGNPIADATGTTLTLSSAELGKWISVRTVATKPGYTTVTTVTSQVGPVIAAPPQQVTVITRPRILGKARVGTKLTVVPGTYSPAVRESYQWLVAGRAVAGATKASFTPRAADARKKVSLRVTATAAGRPPVVITVGSATIARATIRVTRKPVVKRGKATVKKTTRVKAGQRLKVTKGTARAYGTKTKVTYRWYIGKTRVKGKAGARQALRVPKRAVGKRIHVRVTYKATGHTQRTVKTAATAKVRS